MLMTPYLYGQVAINFDTTGPDPSAMLDVKSSSKGVLLPRLTSQQIKNIWKPAAGLMVFNKDSADFYGFNGTSWIALWDPGDTLERMCKDSIYHSGQWYNTIQIGRQCWMAENLNAGVQIPGAAGQQNNGNVEKHCYNDTGDSCGIYGGLYQWDEMMAYSTVPGSQGICPVGWHVPMVSEWDTLTAYLGGSSVAGGKIKETGTRHWKSPNTGATNSSGFSAYGGGTYRPYSNDYFYLIREGGIFWTSNPYSSWGAIRRDLSYLDATLGPYTCERYHSFSVRCLKDE